MTRPDDTTKGAAYRAALIELSHTPRLRRRHAREARWYIEKARQEELDRNDTLAPEVLRLEQMAARHLVCGGIATERIDAILSLIDG